MSTGRFYPAVHATGHSLVMQGDVHGGLQATELTKEQKCHQLFKTVSYETFKDRNPPRVTGTCRWALEHDQFRNWRSSTYDALLWISADPGCGKSVLSKSLVDHDLHSGSDLVTICYFFFKDNEEQDNLAIALCTLLHQLFNQQSSLLRYALPSWEKNGDKLRQESREMWRIFRQCAADSATPPVLCVLDALDECGDEDRRQLIDMLCEVQRGTVHASMGSLKVLVTSRPYDNVQRWFEPISTKWPHIRLRGEDENDQIHKEINLVIDQRMRDVANEFFLSDSDLERLQRQLLHMQHRTYLWLHLAIEEVRELCRDSIYDDEMEIESLPKSVEDAYERMLGKIKDKQKTLARQVLLIIVGARRPLLLDEMAQALVAARAYEHDSSRLRRIDVARLEKQIREQCGLFVFINHSRLFLIHQTAKEFLVAERPNLQVAPGLWKSSFDENKIEKIMATWCVTYLNLAPRGWRASSTRNHSTRDLSGEPHDPEDRDRFFEYCAEHWTSHLQHNDALKDDNSLTSRVLSLYDTHTDLFHAWFPIMWRTFDLYSAVPEVQIQHVVSMSDLAFLLEIIFERSRFDLAAQDSTGRTALHWAAERGYDAVVGWLLKNGADVNAQGGAYGNALSAASAGGHEKVVQKLLDAGADVHAQGGHYGNTLQAASAGGHEEVVQMLLEKGADVHAQGGLYGNTLQAASAVGHEEVVQMLLDTGADVNAQGGRKGNALQTASARGHEKVVQILLEKGADVNAQGGRYGNALEAASTDGHKTVVQKLLDAGADVNAQGGAYGNALQAASTRGHEKVVQMLLDKGADVNAQGKYYDPTTYKMVEGNALQAASARGHEKVVQMLREFRA